MLPTQWKSVGIGVCITAAMLFFSCQRDSHLPTRTVSVSVVPSFGGSVVMTPPDTIFVAGSAVEFLAVPDSGFIFTGWYIENSLRTENPLQLDLTRDIEVSARFSKKPVGMVLITSRNATFRMGSDANRFESPIQTVTFTYDFFIDPYEVTRNSYNSTKGIQNSSTQNDSHPVSNVSWYEAILFCNELSKLRGYDTVYAYSARCSLSGQCPYVLENLVIHYDRFGFRLPTEAEWEYACRGGTTSDFFWGNDTASKYAWFFENADNRSHPVGRKLANTYGLHDMSGNVAEWVNDFLETYSGNPVINPIGPVSQYYEELEKTGMRPIRGGSYRLDVTALRSSSRTGPYDVPAWTIAPDIGFRTVLGAFQPSKKFSPTRRISDSSGIKIECERSELLNFLGTESIRLVFVRRQQGTSSLYSIDFSNPGQPKIQHLPDSLGIHNPSLSPNGKIIAYSSRGAGYHGPSVGTFRSFSEPQVMKRAVGHSDFYLPRFWTPETGIDTFVVFTNGASLNTDQRWITEKTFRQRITRLDLVGAPEILHGSGSYHGGLSRDGRFLATGYPRGLLLDLRLAETTQLFMPPFSGRSDTGQVCNVTITPSLIKPDEVLLLDFGYPKPSSLLGAPYGFHSVIFKCNWASTSLPGNISWFRAPSGFNEWDHVRWSNHPDYSIAVAKKPGRGDSNSVFLINLRKSTALELISGTGLSFPDLWIDPTALAEVPDQYYNFAQYDIPLRHPHQLVLAKKMKLFWNRRNEAEAFFIGSSPTYFGIDPSSIGSTHTLNLGSYMADLVVAYNLACNYILPHSSRTRVIGLSLDCGFFDEELHMEDPWMSGVYDSRGYQFDKDSGFWARGLPTAIQQKISSFDSGMWSGYDDQGYSTNPINGNWGDVLIEKADYSFQNTTVQKNLLVLKSVIDSVTQSGIHFLLVHFPQHPGYRNTSHIGRYGPSRETYRELERWLRKLESENTRFHFYDANNYGNHDYTDDDALDCNHLGHRGAKKLSTRIDSLFSIYGSSP